MEIAICDKGSGYSVRWIECCRERGLPFRMVNCHDSDIVAQLRSADVLLWSPDHTLAADLLLARDLIQALELAGIVVYPSTATFWHFDNKLAQKYLLESLGFPLVPTYSFFRKDAALAWIDKTTFPKVFKLRRGAGSTNVQLVRDAGHARRLVATAFGAGFKPVAPLLSDAATKIRRHRRAGDWAAALKRLPSSFLRTLESRRSIVREKGYIYFQDFIPANAFDIRITVIGSRGFGFTRNVRPNDFRASGSGELDYDLSRIDPRCVQIGFAVAKAMNSQSLALDFVMHPDGHPLLTEISYGFVAGAVNNCPGWWDPDLNWHEGHVRVEDTIIDLVLDQAQSVSKSGDGPVMKRV